MRNRTLLAVLTFTIGGVFVLADSASTLAEGGSSGLPLVNWTAPTTYTPPRTGMHFMSGEIGLGPLPFFPVNPCRQYDSRNSTPLASGVNRTVTLIGAPCGVPAIATAVSVNITIFNITGAGSNGVFKVDTVSPPTIAWINYPPSEAQRGNAGVVPLTGGGAIIVQAAQGAGQVDFTVDLNGYYPASNPVMPLPSGDFFRVVGSVSGVPISPGVVEGYNVSTGGGATGVLGLTSSTGTLSAGVRGLSASGEPAGASSCCGDIGVLGESKTGYGVAGISERLAGFFDLKDSGGSIIAGAFAGYQVLANSYAFYAQPGDFGGTGAKYFVEPHPTNPSRIIRYVSLEGPESGTYFRGTGQTSNGTALIEVPEDFRFVTDEEGLTVQLTPVGAPAALYVLSQDLNEIVVKASRDVKFHYMVNGVRRAFKDHQPITEGLEFMPRGPEDRMAEGLRPELKRRLIANETYNADGTVNMQTAERVGWTKVWADRVASARAAAESARANIRK